MSNANTELYEAYLKKRGQAVAPVQAQDAPAQKSRRKPRHLEDYEQTVVIQWARINERKIPALRWLFHIPNGGKRNEREAARLKAQGVLAGVADLFLPYASRDYFGLWCELKAEGGTLTDAQREFLQAMEARGYCAKVAFGASAAIELIEWYLEIRK